LARSLRQEYGAEQIAAGRTAWLTPPILPWTAFVEQLSEQQTPLLTPAQELALWESIVEASPESAHLIQPHAAARLAGEAWRLIHEWRIPFSTAWHATAETSAFHAWAQQFEFHTRWLDRTDFARLSAAASGPIWLAGFDELTPRQSKILA